MPLAAEEPARRVEADPPGADEVHLRPSVEVDDVAGDAARLVRDHPFVGELDEVAAREPRREARRAHRRHEEHGRVAAAPPPFGERLLRGPDAALFANDVAKPLVHGLVQGHDPVDRLRDGRHFGQERIEERPRRVGGVRRVEIGSEIARELARILERHLLAARVDEEVERVHRPDVDRHLDEEVEGGHPLPRLERDARDVISGGILLPPQPARLRDVERVGLYLRLRMGGGAKANRVRPEGGRAVVAVVSSVLEEKAH